MSKSFFTHKSDVPVDFALAYRAITHNQATADDWDTVEDAVRKNGEDTVMAWVESTWRENGETNDIRIHKEKKWLKKELGLSEADFGGLVDRVMEAKFPSVKKTPRGAWHNPEDVLEYLFGGKAVSVVPKTGFLYSYLVTGHTKDPWSIRFDETATDMDRFYVMVTKDGYTVIDDVRGLTQINRIVEISTVGDLLDALQSPVSRWEPW